MMDILYLYKILVFIRYKWGVVNMFENLLKGLLVLENKEILDYINSCNDNLKIRGSFFDDKNCPVELVFSKVNYRKEVGVLINLINEGIFNEVAQLFDKYNVDVYKDFHAGGLIKV